jgi:pimeloyl-ACP methyl ester carboxylesterase
MTRTTLAKASIVAACVVASITSRDAAAQMPEWSDQTLTAGDGTAFVVTSGTVRVPELRNATKDPSRMIDIAFVRVRREGSLNKAAHTMLAGGPGDSGINLALGVAEQGGAMLGLIHPNDVAIDQLAQTALVLRSRLGVESAMKHMMDLSSGATGARRARISREAATALLANAINFPGMELQDAWGAPELEEDFRQPVRSDVPTLMLVGDLDPRTPVENALEIAGTLTNAHVVVLENATHQFDLFGSVPIRAVLGQFLHGERNIATRLALAPLTFQR